MLERFSTVPDVTVAPAAPIIAFMWTHAPMNQARRLRTAAQTRPAPLSRAIVALRGPAKAVSRHMHPWDLVCNCTSNSMFA